MLRLPKSLRKELRKPFGELHKSVNLIEKSLQKQLEEDKLIISIGDVTSMKLFENGIQPQICIVDNLTKREPIEHNLDHTNNIKYVDNPAGVLTEEFIEVCIESIKEASKNKPKSFKKWHLKCNRPITSHLNKRSPSIGSGITHIALQVFCTDSFQGRSSSRISGFVRNAMLGSTVRSSSKYLKTSRRFALAVSTIL